MPEGGPGSSLVEARREERGSQGQEGVGPAEKCQNSPWVELRLPETKGWQVSGKKTSQQEREAACFDPHALSGSSGSTGILNACSSLRNDGSSEKHSCPQEPATLRRSLLVFNIHLDVNKAPASVCC